MTATLKIYETNLKISERLYNYLLPKIKNGLKNAMRDIDNYYNDVFIEKMIEKSSLVKWIRSNIGRGFLGWTKEQLEEEIAKMKYEMKRQRLYVLKNTVLEIDKIDSEKLEEILKIGVKRYDRFVGGSKMYTFIEPWYDWITNGYTATSSTGVYKVLYRKGLGFSGLAKMVDIKSPEAASAKPNSIKQIEAPAAEVHRENFKIISDNLIRIVINNIEMELN